MYWRRSSSATLKEFGNICLLSLSVPLHEEKMWSIDVSMENKSEMFAGNKNVCCCFKTIILSSITIPKLF